MSATASPAVIDRLRAVIRLAEHPGTPKHEAEAAWARARTMAQKYDLDLERFKTAPAGGRPASSTFGTGHAWFDEMGDADFQAFAEAFAKAGRPSRPFYSRGFDPGRDTRSDRRNDFYEDETASEKMQRERDAHYERTRREARKKLDRAAAFLGALEATHVGDGPGRWIIPDHHRWATSAEMLEEAQRRGFMDNWIDPADAARLWVGEAAKSIGASRAQNTQAGNRWYFRGTSYTAEQLIIVALQEGWIPARRAG